MLIQLLLFRTPTEPLSVLSFIVDVGPLMLASLLFSSFVFFCWYFGYALQKHKRKQRLWLVKNKELIEQGKAFQLNLRDFGEQVGCCKNCKSHDMQLWDYQQQLLVVRCRSCKMNYTFSKERNHSILQVLHQIERVSSLLKTLVAYRRHGLGKLLAATLDIDITSISSETSPLEIVHFTTRNETMIASKSVADILIYDWEVVFPEKSKQLAI